MFNLKEKIKVGIVRQKIAEPAEVHQPLSTKIHACARMITDNSLLRFQLPNYSSN